MKRKLLAILLLFLACLLVTSLGAESTSIPGLSHFVLNNGMELFIFENHTVPLVKIQITFRCGSVAQNKDTAGLFHLYEHMLFKGNKIFKSDSEFQAAMKELGVSGWNGGTSTEFVDYYFTIPAEKLEKGIRFWASAVRFPLFLTDELETEKQVVINEIRGSHNDPSRIFQSAMNKNLFYLYPWRKDPTGSEEIIKKATRETLLEIQRNYYLPNNAALFLGGDVDPKRVLEIVKTYFDDWQAGPSPWGNGIKPHPFLPADKYLIYADDSMYEGIMAVDLRMRGPDVLADPRATYAADVWLMLLEDPNGRFKTNISLKVPGIYKKELINASYFTQRDGASISFGTYLVIDQTKDSAGRVLLFKKAVQEEMRDIIRNPDYFSSGDFNSVKTRLEDRQLIEMETAENLVSSLSFWWSSADTQYYLNYSENMKKVTLNDVKEYINKYIIGRKILLGVVMNPSDYEKEKAKFKEKDFQEIQKQNAFWWSGQ